MCGGGKLSNVAVSRDVEDGQAPGGLGDVAEISSWMWRCQGLRLALDNTMQEAASQRKNCSTKGPGLSSGESPASSKGKAEIKKWLQSGGQIPGTLRDPGLKRELRV